jgi:hypothetical protein
MAPAGNNTGAIGFVFDNDLANKLNDLPNTPPAWCNFMLLNYSIASCSWGPWGPGNFDRAPNYLYTFIAISEPFELQNAENSTEPTVISNPADQTGAGSGRAIQTTGVNVTCPPEGIPSQSATATMTEEFWPTMASNLTFPTLDCDC